MPLPNRLKTQAPFLALLGGLLLLNSAAVAEPDDVAEDFGAETIIGDPGLVSSNLPLPVELVEEQSPAFVPKTIETRKDETSVLGKEVLAGLNNADEMKQDATDDSAMSTLLMNLNEVEIPALIETFSRATKRNYIVGSGIKGKVTLHLPTPVSSAEALKIFDTILLLNGYTTVPTGKNIWKVIPARDARQTTIPLVEDAEKNASDILVTHLVRLKHVQAQDMRQLLSQFVSKDGVISSFAGTNALIFIDSQANISRLINLVKQLDVPPQDQEITIIPVVHADANDIADKIQEILGLNQDSGNQRPGRAIRTSRNATRRTDTTRRRRTSRNPRGGTNPGGVDVSQALPVKLIADERTNALIVVADPATTLKIQALAEQLDSPLDLSGGRFYVYQLKHADAEQLSEIITQLISGAAPSSDTRTSTRGSSLTRASRDNQASRERATPSGRIAEILRRRRSTGGARGSLGEGGKVQFEGEVSIAPDPATNSLIINAARTDYMRVKELIDQLDIKRRQVIVEATILEVSLNKEEGMGIELQGSAGAEEGGALAQTNFGGLTNLLTNPAGLSDLTIAAASTGTLTLPGGLVIPSQAILITALSRLSNVNVLSAPTILTTDNEEAEIIVGENVPFVASTSTNDTNLNNTFNSIERQDVGITLRITPQISTGNFVTLKIFVEISNVVPGTRNDPNGPTTTIRTTETTVEVQSDQMIVTGGLISDNLTESTRGVPFLQDIPFIGQFFQRQDQTHRKQNLLVFITPRILKDQFDARDTTIERRDALNEVITRRNINPDRQKVLFSRNIDNVVERSKSKSVLPSTITPPKKVNFPNNEALGNLAPDELAAVKRTKRRLRSLTNGDVALTKKQTNEVKEDENGVLDIRVKPKLPGSVTKSKKSNNIASRGAAMPSATASYIVIRQVGGTPKTRTALPFAVVDKYGTVGLKVLGSIDSPTSQFFEVGGRYIYRQGPINQQFICLGKYATSSEAAAIHSGLDNNNLWHSMSPQEVMNLGKGPWSKG